MLTLEQKENNFWAVVQNAAKKRSAFLFMDVPSGKEVETDRFRAFDTFGWLIPEVSVDDFRKDLKAGTHDSGQWDQFFVNESFQINGDEIIIQFESLN